MMENLINDLLDLAKLENNTFKLTYDYFSLSNTIYEAFQMLSFSIIEKDVEIKAVIDKDVNLNLIQLIHGDQRRYLQILLNFLSNSLKFTNQGGCITVRVEILEEQVKELGTSGKNIRKVIQRVQDKLLSNDMDSKDKISFIKRSIEQ